MTDLALPVAKTAVWAGTAWLLGRRLLEMLESGINRTLDRLRRAGPAEFDALPTAPQSESQATLAPPASTSTGLLAPVAPESLLGVFEQGVRDAVGSTPAPDREKALVRLAASMQLCWVFETINAAVLGSQLSLLLQLNSSAVPLTNARSIYDAAAKQYSEYYSTYPFDRWLHWFVDTAKFATQDAGQLTITEPGREFLKYIIARGYSVSRHG